MKIRGVMARKGDTPDYVNKMQQEVFDGCWRRLGQKWRLCSIGQEVARQDLKK